MSRPDVEPTDYLRHMQEERAHDLRRAMATVALAFVLIVAAWVLLAFFPGPVP